MEQFQTLPIEKVFESPLNPRQHFNPKKMEELVESVRAKGILVPLLVRPNNDRLEIAAGHRRYRAALKMGLKEIPLLVRDMNDADFLEVLIIENDQHEDLEPLEQARGYQTLMKEGKYDIPAIALKISKSESWVYQRIKLLELVPEGQELLTNGKITAGHAIMIARLQPDQQKDLLKKESGLYEGWGPDRTVVSVRDLAEYIERQIHLDLNSASLKKTDPDLVPEAGPCTTCPKRTGFTPALFPEIKKKDTCTDPSCFQKKVDAFMGRWIHDRSQDSDVPPLRLSANYDGRMKKVPDDPKKPIPSQLYHVITDRKKESCSSAREGIITEGHDRGRILTVCADPKCEKHHRRREPAPEHQKYVAQQKAADAKRKQEKAFRLRITDAILKGVRKLDKADLAFIASQLYDELWQEYQKDILQRHNLKFIQGKYTIDAHTPGGKYIESSSEADLCKLIMEMALIRNQEPRNRGGKKVDVLMAVAQRYGVKVKAIEASMKQEIKDKAREKAAKDKKKSPSLKQKKKAKREDPPKAMTIPMDDLCKLHGPARKKDEAGRETAEIRIPVDQQFLAMVEKSYSGDLLSNGGCRIREPFEWEGDFYVCLGGMSSGAQGDFWKEAWKVMPANLFEGKTYSYGELTAKWDKDEKERGNHNGRRVLLKNKKYILEGPRIVFYDSKLEEVKPMPGVCQICGCTETTPCEGGCAWTDKTKTLCAACQRAKEHHWEKQNLVTVAATSKVPMHDIYKCTKCGAKGKRFGFESIRPDKPFTELTCLGPKKEVQTPAK